MYGRSTLGAIHPAMNAFKDGDVRLPEINRDVPAIGQAMERLSKAISFLDDAACQLHERVVPIRRENPVADGATAPQAPGNSPLCLSIIAEAARVEALAEALMATTNELEI